MTAQRDVEREIQALGDLDLDGLRRVWRERLGEPPALRSAEVLRLMLAWRLQAEVYSGLDGWSRRQLKADIPLAAPASSFGPGAKITRVYQGRRIEVITTPQGFSWEGRTYASLSAIARAVTGVRWNGPRFFGLRSGS